MFEPVAFEPFWLKVIERLGHIVRVCSLELLICLVSEFGAVVSFVVWSQYSVLPSARHFGRVYLYAASDQFSDVESDLLR